MDGDQVQINICLKIEDMDTTTHTPSWWRAFIEQDVIPTLEYRLDKAFNPDGYAFEAVAISGTFKVTCSLTLKGSLTTDG